jgi:hypothetical protein
MKYNAEAHRQGSDTFQAVFEVHDALTMSSPHVMTIPQSGGKITIHYPLLSTVVQKKYCALTSISCERYFSNSSLILTSGAIILMQRDKIILFLN